MNYTLTFPIYRCDQYSAFKANYQGTSLLLLRIPQRLSVTFPKHPLLPTVIEVNHQQNHTDYLLDNAHFPVAEVQEESKALCLLYECYQAYSILNKADHLNDCSLDNIHLNGESIVIIDFGLKIKDFYDYQSTPLAIKYYDVFQHPSILLGNQKQDFLWNLSIILFALLCGRSTLQKLRSLILNKQKYLPYLQTQLQSRKVTPQTQEFLFSLLNRTITWPQINLHSVFQQYNNTIQLQKRYQLSKSTKNENASLKTSSIQNMRTFIKFMPKLDSKGLRLSQITPEKNHLQSSNLICMKNDSQSYLFHKEKIKSCFKKTSQSPPIRRPSIQAQIKFNIQKRKKCLEATDLYQMQSNVNVNAQSLHQSSQQRDFSLKNIRMMSRKASIETQKSEMGRRSSSQRSFKKEQSTNQSQEQSETIQKQDNVYELKQTIFSEYDSVNRIQENPMKDEVLLNKEEFVYQKDNEVYQKENITKLIVQQQNQSEEKDKTANQVYEIIENNQKAKVEVVQQKNEKSQKDQVQLQKGQKEKKQDLDLEIEDLDELEIYEVNQNKDDGNMEEFKDKMNRGLEIINFLGNCVVECLDHLNGLQNFWIIPLFLIFKRMVQLRFEVQGLLEDKDNIFGLKGWNSLVKKQEYKQLLDQIENENGIIYKEMGQLLDVAIKKASKLEDSRRSKVEWFLNEDLSQDIKDTVFVYFYTQLYENLKSQKEVKLKLVVEVQVGIMVNELEALQYPEDMIDLGRVKEARSESRLVQLKQQQEATLEKLKQRLIGKGFKL